MSTAAHDGHTTKDDWRLTLARYGYYFSDELWFIKKPSLSLAATTPNVFSELVADRTTSQGIRISYYIDGLIALDFSNYPALSKEEAEYDEARRSGFPSHFTPHKHSAFLRRRTELINTHSILLKHNIEKIQRFGVATTVTPPSSTLMISSPDAPENGIMFKSLREQILFKIRYTRICDSGLPIEFDDRIFKKVWVVSDEVITATLSQFDSCVEAQSSGAIDICNLVNLGIQSIENHDFPRSIICFWVAIEALLNKRWSRHIKELTKEAEDDGEPIMSKARKHKLTSN